MHNTHRSARPAAALALAMAATLLVPGAALATTTAPTPSTTSGAPAPSTTTPPVTTSTTSTADPVTTTGTPSTTTSTETGSASSTTSTRSGAGTPVQPKSLDAGTDRVPFGTSTARIAAATPTEQAGYAGGFIVRTLAARGDHYNYPASTFFDGGNTIDAILALDGAKVGLDEADAATDYLAANIDAYIGYPDPDPADDQPDGWETYAGPTGKLVIGVVAQGGDPADFGGQDLVARLEALLTAEGRFSDASQYGDYSNTIGQALDVIALGRATGSVPDAAVDYLLAQQCADGGFRGNLAAAGAACSSDTDATGFAAQALAGLLGTGDPLTVRALTYLSSKQSANGGFLNGDGQYNANTAGVAAQAFAAGGWTIQLTRAQTFLAGLQFDCTAPASLRGGIAFTAADLATLRATPTNTAAIDRTLRATPQATLGLAGGSLLTVTAEGSAEAAPTLTCSTTTTTTTTTAPTTTAPSSPTSGAASTPTTASASPAASATPGDLAFTGSNVAAMVLLALVLLAVGMIASVVARRKGAHA